jgi:hypothetical protein
MQTETQHVANIALDRPANASSMAEGHQSRLAADGNDATAWIAAADAALPQWWESDFEGIYDVSSVSIRFAGMGKYGYEIQTSSDDRGTWKTVVSGDTQGAGLPAEIELPVGTRSSGLRIVLDTVSAGTAPGLAEVAIRGARSK